MDELDGMAADVSPLRTAAHEAMKRLERAVDVAVCVRACVCVCVCVCVCLAASETHIAVSTLYSLPVECP